MADMIDFRDDYKSGEFTKYDYKFHACHAHMESRKLYGDPKSARFISYSTTMAGIVANGTVYVRKDFDCYSRTTTRQVIRFLEDLTGMYISLHGLRKAIKGEDTSYADAHGIVFVPIDFINDNF